MTKRIFYVLVGCLALLALWGLNISRGVAQEGTGERMPSAPEEVDAHSNYIPVQGRLTDPSGNPLDGTFVMSFRIYSAYIGGTALCEDLNNSVDVEDGLFITYMSLTGCRAFDGRQLYLGVQVGSDTEMTPRQYIDNVPYAYGLRPGAVISDTIGNDALLHIENWATTGRGLRAYGMSQTGVNYGIVGASRSPDGFGGYFYNTGGGVGVYGESPSGVAIAANGAITSTAPTYLWISGNDVVRYEQNDSTVINLMSNGGAALRRGADTTTTYVVLPVTIAGTLYGQNVRVAALDIYWQGETDFDALVDMRLRRQTGACWTCYRELIHDPADHICDTANNAQGCTLHYDLTTENILTPDSGILYLLVGLNFSSPSTEVRLGGARLTLEYDD